jgi:probable F420-dependent oxidoreductase
MRIGALLPVTYRPTRGALKEYAEAAERLGYDSLWANSHIAVPRDMAPNYPYTPNGVPPWGPTNDWADAMTSLAFVAAVTSKARLGTSVIPLVTTDPLTLAKQAATLDVLSEGRFELGVGGGWMTEEGEALGRPVDHRVGRLAETIDIVRLAWTHPSFAFDGRFYSFPELGVHPQPVQGGDVPIWLGGHGDAFVRVAREKRCGILYWYPTPAALAEFAQRAEGVRLGTSMRLADADDWAGHARALANTGAELLVVTPKFDAEPLAQLEQFSREVAPLLR